MEFCACSTFTFPLCSHPNGRGRHGTRRGLPDTRPSPSAPPRRAFPEGSVRKREVLLLCVYVVVARYRRREKGSPLAWRFPHAVWRTAPHRPNATRCGVYCLGALEGEWASAGWCSPHVPPTTIAPFQTFSLIFTHMVLPQLTPHTTYIPTHRRPIDPNAPLATASIRSSIPPLATASTRSPSFSRSLTVLLFAPAAALQLPQGVPQAPPRPQHRRPRGRGGALQGTVIPRRTPCSPTPCWQRRLF